MNRFSIIEKPSYISWDAISEVLRKAHEKNAVKGFMQNTVNISGEEMREKVGNGRCFVAIDGEKVVGTLSIVPKMKKAWFVNGKALYYMLLGILPEYQGLGIYSRLILARENYAKEHGLKVTYMYTAEQNKKMRRLAIKEGFRLVSYSVSPQTDYYSVVMAKWMGECPYSIFYCYLHFYLNKFYIHLRYKPRGIKRFGI